MLSFLLTRYVNVTNGGNLHIENPYIGKVDVQLFCFTMIMNQRYEKESLVIAGSQSINIHAPSHLFTKLPYPSKGFTKQM